MHSCSIQTASAKNLLFKRGTVDLVWVVDVWKPSSSVMLTPFKRFIPPASTMLSEETRRNTTTLNMHLRREKEKCQWCKNTRTAFVVPSQKTKVFISQPQQRLFVSTTFAPLLLFF